MDGAGAPPKNTSPLDLLNMDDDAPPPPTDFSKQVDTLPLPVMQSIDPARCEDLSSAMNPAHMRAAPASVADNTTAMLEEALAAGSASSARGTTGASTGSSGAGASGGWAGVTAGGPTGGYPAAQKVDMSQITPELLLKAQELLAAQQKQSSAPKPPAVPDPFSDL